MKKRTFLSLLFVCSFCLVWGQKTSKSYVPAYETNSHARLRIAKESQLNRKSPEVIEYLKKYPVLERLEDFSSKKKYSMILSTLIRDKRESEKNDGFIFILKNGKEYRIKEDKRVNTTSLVDEAKGQ